MAEVKISQLPAGQKIANVSGTLEIDAAGNSLIKSLAGTATLQSGSGNVILDSAAGSGFVTITNTSGLALKLGNTTSAATATPLSINLGGTYSSSAGANPKILLYDDLTNKYGIGVSIGSMDYIAPLAGNSHNFYVDGTHAFMISDTTITAPTSVTTPAIVTPAATDLNINATTGFVRLNSNNMTGIGTAIGVALDFPSLINTNTTGAIDTTIGSIIGDVRFTPGTGKSIDAVSNPIINVTTLGVGTVNATTINSVNGNFLTATGADQSIAIGKATFAHPSILFTGDGTSYYSNSTNPADVAFLRSAAGKMRISDATLTGSATLEVNNLTSFSGDLTLSAASGFLDFVSNAVKNATITDTSNNVAANSLKSATTLVNVAAATAPSAGQVLTATSSTTATWQANSSLAWTALTTTTVSAAVNNGYIATGGSLQTFTLPVTSAVGDIIEIAGSGTGGWVMAQNASQNIRVGNVISQTGTGGSIASSAQGDTLRIVCFVANTSWIQIGSPVGNLTIVT